MTGGARKIIFMGTPDFAVPSLNALAKHHDVMAVYSQPPRPSGRGMKLTKSPVHKAAEALGIDVQTPLHFRDDDAVQNLRKYAPQFLVVVAYGLILPQAVLDIPSMMPINGHASLLPRWRGAAPIHHAIASGDAETGVTSMVMQAGLDTGPMLLAEKTPILADDNTGILHDRLSEMTADILVKTLAEIDSITAIPQDDDLACWADKISPSDAQINFGQKVLEIDQRIRGFTPFPGAWLSLNNDDGDDEEGRMIRLKVKSAQIRHDKTSAKSGTVLGIGAEGGPLIAAADGTVELTQVQPQGKAAMTGRDFLNGYVMPARIHPSKEGSS